MHKREAQLKSDLFARVRRDRPDFLVLQIATAGAPDREVVGNGRTTYWECKHGTPDFVSKGNQKLMCQRLAKQSYCRYILWLEDEYNQRTLIVHPLHIYTLTAEAEASGFNHVFASTFIQKVHCGHFDQ